MRAIAIRTQADQLQDQYSLAGGLDTGQETLTRQEFAEEADINVLLKKFGVTTQTRTGGTFGEFDMNLDRQQAQAIIADAQAITATIPPELKQAFPNWQAVVNDPQNYAEALDSTTKARAARAVREEARDKLERDRAEAENAQTQPEKKQKSDPK